jgi:hypothetical protein
MGEKQAAGGKPRPRDQNAPAPQLKVDDIGRTIGEGSGYRPDFPS